MDSPTATTLDRERIAYYDEIAEHFDRYYPSAGHLRPIDDVLVGMARGRVLEIGCGTGRLLDRIAGRLVVGVDPSQGMCRVAASRGLQVIRAAAEALPFRPESFDTVVSGDNAVRETIWHVHFPEVARVLSPEGRFAFHLYNDATQGVVRSVLRGIRWRRGDGWTLNWAYEAHVIRAARRGGFRKAKVLCSRGIPFTRRSVFLPRWLSHLCDNLLFVFEPEPDARIARALRGLAADLADRRVASVRLGDLWHQPPFGPGALVRVARGTRLEPGEVALVDEADGLSARRVLGTVVIAGRLFHLCDGPEPRLLEPGELQGRVVSVQTSVPETRAGGAMASYLLSRAGRRLAPWLF